MWKRHFYYEREMHTLWFSDYKSLVADLIKQYGDEYEYNEDEYNGKPIYEYTWMMSFPRRVSCSIHADKTEEGKHWVIINSFHN